MSSKDCSWARRLDAGAQVELTLRVEEVQRHRVEGVAGLGLEALTLRLEAAGLLVHALGEVFAGALQGSLWHGEARVARAAQGLDLADRGRGLVVSPHVGVTRDPLGPVEEVAEAPVGAALEELALDHRLDALLDRVGQLVVQRPALAIALGQEEERVAVVVDADNISRARALSLVATTRQKCERIGHIGASARAHMM